MAYLGTQLALIRFEHGTLNLVGSGPVAILWRVATGHGFLFSLLFPHLQLNSSPYCQKSLFRLFLPILNFVPKPCAKGIAMAAFKQHISVSSALGVAYTASLIYMGTEWSLAALGGVLCGIGAMLLLQRLREMGLTREAIILGLIGCYFVFRFGAPMILGVLTVHRGMFHSIPAALIAAEIVFLAHKTTDIPGSVKLALGVLIGFLSHLVMDELWSVNLSGISIRLNKAAGSALKLFSPSLPATCTAYLILAALTYLVGVREGYFAPVQLPFPAVTASVTQP
jgi:membrane-bound metal-dependent hydrolase YbcI (DUF457 family)